ncbi:NAD-dependent deacetylase [Paraburkholderia sediminicola]|uniref:SIR2 family NAD-dependent protein deacylase n=1 Tax=Paraburkholderia sediminicola TaxID=458836 RepID=UPI0038BBF176
MEQPQAIEQAATWLRDADGLLVTAGAGMGVDSGLPDFRGNEGLWRAYPALGTARIGFESMANPASFHDDPTLAWGFYGHRLKLYREIEPHAGFTILKRWGERIPRGAFVYTSNVDGQFQRAGFAEDRVVECHGTIHHMQCIEPCSSRIWPVAGFEPQVDEEACRLVGALPRCPECGALARPNVLMFGDYGWLARRTDQQEARLQPWLASVARPVIVEIGAGTTLSTIRQFSERHGPRVIRINAREPQIDPVKGVGILGGALAALVALDQALEART